MQAQFEMAAMIASAVKSLVRSRDPEGHLRDVRSTSLACWAIAETLDISPATPDGRALQVICRKGWKWLESQSRPESGGLTWESEAWDTSQAILALLFQDGTDPSVAKAAAWLKETRDKDYGAWYEEVWETTFSTVALLRAVTQGRSPVAGTERWLNEVLVWIISIPSKPDGYFIAPHYCGFLSWILAEMRRAKIRPGLVASHAEFESKATAAASWLLTQLDRTPHLWSNYTFSNSCILYALAALQPPGFPTPNCIDRVAAWFKHQQSPADGSFEDIEDTSYAILALSSLLALAVGRDHAAKLVRQELGTLQASVHCFVGYSTKSRSKFEDLRAHLSQMFPQLVVEDWKERFQPGHHLFAEISCAREECELAIFLVTKDDNIMQADGSQIAKPRDNIIFEVGFFAGRRGFSKTLLLVEEDTHGPTDWGGILYLPLNDREGLDRALQRMLAE